MDKDELELMKFFQEIDKEDVVSNVIVTKEDKKDLLAITVNKYTRELVDGKSISRRYFIIYIYKYITDEYIFSDIVSNKGINSPYSDKHITLINTSTNMPNFENDYSLIICFKDLNLQGKKDLSDDLFLIISLLDFK